jgi:hypothetical protein
MANLPNIFNKALPMAKWHIQYTKLSLPKSPWLANELELNRKLFRDHLPFILQDALVGVVAQIRYLKVHSHLVLGTLGLSPVTRCMALKTSCHEIFMLS